MSNSSHPVEKPSHSGHDHSAIPGGRNDTAKPIPTPQPTPQEILVSATVPVDGVVKDIVCGMNVALDKGKPSLQYKGNVFHFCGQKCCTRFETDPWFYLSGNKYRKQLSKPKGNLYTCPMDPEIVQQGPGTCPICGMALEPMDGVSDGPNHELIDFTRRLWVSAGAGVLLVILSMGSMLALPIRHYLGASLSLYLEFLLASPVVLWAAWPFMQRGFASILSRNYNMWTLIMLGVLTAYVYSTLALFLPQLFPADMLDAHGYPPVYFEASVVIIALVFVGQVMELRARERTGDAIRALIDLAPKTARRITPDGDEMDVPLENIIAGDTLRIRPGDGVPVDGWVIEGSSAVDESMMTGESLPVAKQSGDKVTGGTINRNGTLVVKTLKVGDETVLAQIVSMVISAQRSRAPMQALADKVANWFVPVVVAIALLAFFVWLIFGPQPSLVYAVLALVSVLIIACPCALGLATPMSVMTATGRGAQAGILIKDAAALERMTKIDTLVVDKTGTLTQGRPDLVDVIALEGMDERELLALAGGLERGSEHPIAEAIGRGVETRGIKPADITDFQSVPGKGASAYQNGRKIAIGNAAMMALERVTISDNDYHDALGSQGKTVIFLAVDGKLAGLLTVADTIKAEAAKAIDQLQRDGIRVIMASGDAVPTAQAVASTLGIMEVRAGLLPEHKKALIEELQAKGCVVAMAGDGVNDAPALAASDVGIAMGSGADVSLECAGITLLNGDISGIHRARILAVASLANIKQNLWFAFGYNSIGVPIAAGILYPFTGTLLSPMLAAGAMSLSSVSVIVNSLRLRSVKLNRE